MGVENVVDGFEQAKGLVSSVVGAISNIVEPSVVEIEGQVLGEVNMHGEGSVVVPGILLDLLLYKQGFVSGGVVSGFLGDHRQEHKYRCREAYGPFEEESERHGKYFLVEENVHGHQIGKLDQSWADRCTCSKAKSVLEIANLIGCSAI